jgi:hypothetical protein
MAGVFQNIDPPIPLTARRVCTSRLWCGGRGGWGVNILEDARHSSVLYVHTVYKYFVFSARRFGEDHSSNPGQGKSKNFSDCTLKQLKVLYDAAFLWHIFYICIHTYYAMVSAQYSPFSYESRSRNIVLKTMISPSVNSTFSLNCAITFVNTFV